MMIVGNMFLKLMGIQTTVKMLYYSTLEFLDQPFQPIGTATGIVNMYGHNQKDGSKQEKKYLKNTEDVVLCVEVSKMWKYII